MSAWDISVCQTCLSADRVLYPMCRLEILKELHILQLHDQGRICWECQCLISKIYKFKFQALHAQNILSNNLESKYLGRLSQKTKNDFDYVFSHAEDPLYEECPIKFELIIKEEECCDINNENSFQQDSLSNRSEEVKDIRLDEIVEVNELIENYDNENTNDSEVKLLENVKKNSVVHSQNSCEEKVKSKKEIIVTKKDKQKPILLQPQEGMISDSTSNNPKEAEKNDSKEDTSFHKVTVISLTEEELRERREKKWRHYIFQSLPYKCEPCVLGFRTKEKYKSHIEKVHDEKNGPHVCPVCTARFPDFVKIEAHKQKHFNINRCTACEFESTVYHAVIMHYGEKHSDRQKRARIQEFVCDVCRKTFNSEARLDAHASKHNTAHAKEMRHCAVCDVTYKNIYIYRSHFKNSAKHSDRQYKCKECGKEFFSKAYYKRHYEFFHLKRSKYKCEHCDKPFITHSALLNHQKIHHGSNRPRNYPCEECNKKFFTKGMLRSHRLIHSAQRSYMCEECGDTFKQRAALYTHTRLLHKGTKTKK